MARTLVASNGRLFIALDSQGLVRELCWPMVGYRNHLLGRWVRLGLSFDGNFSWLDSDDWRRHQHYVPGTDVALTGYEHFSGSLTVRVTDSIEGDRDVWHRSVELTNRTVDPLAVTLFQSQQPFLNQQNIGLCAMVLPVRDGILHFHDETYLLFAKSPVTRAEESYTCGMASMGGREGTWRDAEDGALQGDPVGVGSVDSTLGLAVQVPPQAARTLRLYCCAASAEKGLVSPESVVSPHPDWSPDLIDHLGEFEHRCRRILLDHVGPSGQVVAACDSAVMGENTETYSYVWLRDCALSLQLLAAEGFDRRCEFLGFATKLARHQGFFHQRYQPNGSPASTWHPRTVDYPFQQDETALMLSLCAACPDWASEPTHREFVRSLVEVTVGHIGEDSLPLPSFDLWEERYGVHFWTVCTVVQGLLDVSRLAGFDEVRTTAKTMWDALLTKFVNVDGGFARRIDEQGNPDTTTDASVLAGLLHCELATNDHLATSVAQIERDLTVHSTVGGIARYQGDYYARVDESFPGNPWVICTMWLAQAFVRLGRTGEAKAWLDWAKAIAGPTGVLPEQLHPVSGASMTVMPLPWSHAEVLKLARMLQPG